MKHTFLTAIFLFAIIFFSSCSDDGANDAAALTKLPPALNEIKDFDTLIPSDNLRKRAYLIVYNTGSTYIRDRDKLGGGYLLNSAGEKKATDTSSRATTGSIINYFSREREVGVAQESTKERFIKRVFSRAESKKNGALDDEHTEGDRLNLWVDKFFLGLSNSEGAFEEKEYELKKSGTYCDVWATPSLELANDNHNKDDLPKYKVDYKAQFGHDYIVGDTTFEMVVNVLDRAFADEMKIFGTNEIKVDSPAFISTPKKIHILISQLFYGKNSDGTPNVDVCGFYSANSLYLNGSGSNKTQCLYMNNNIAKDILFGTIVHEMQHILNSIKSVNYKTSYAAPWFNESLSVMAEDVLFDVLGASDMSFLEFVIPFNKMAYLGYGVWQRKSYGPAYFFLNYLARTFGGGRPVAFIRDLSLSSYVNKDAIDNILKSYGYDLTMEDALVGTAQYYLNNPVLPTTKKEMIDGSNFCLHGVTTNIECYKNTASEVGRPKELGVYGFYVIDLGVTDAGDHLIVSTGDGAPGIRTFILYK